MTAKVAKNDERKGLNVEKTTSDKFFQLLRYSIDNSAECSVNISSEEWNEFYEIAQQQSLLGIFFYGLQKLQRQYGKGMMPPKKLFVKWYASYEQIIESNEKTNKAAVRLSDFFRRHGFRTCILKGQGNALYYPNPNVRTSGDIDIWVEGGDKKVLRFVCRFVSKTSKCYHHVQFKHIHGIDTEVHYRPAFMNNLVHNHRLQKWFMEQAEAQFQHEAQLPNLSGVVCVPTDSFNRIFQMVHIYNHIMHEGIGLRQIVDYYYLLERGLSEEGREREIMLLKRCGLYDVATAVMFVLHERLGLSMSCLLVPPNKRLGQFLLNEIMVGGNFGQFDTRVKHGGSQWARNIRRFRRDWQLMQFFPSECRWEPVFRCFNFLWRVVHR